MYRVSESPMNTIDRWHGSNGQEEEETLLLALASVNLVVTVTVCGTTAFGDPNRTPHHRAKIAPDTNILENLIFRLPIMI